MKYEREIKIHKEKALIYEREIKIHKEKENKLESELEVYKKKNQNYIIQNLDLIKRSNNSEELKNLYKMNKILTSLKINYEQEKNLNEIKKRIINNYLNISFNCFYLNY